MWRFRLYELEIGCYRSSTNNSRSICIRSAASILQCANNPQAFTIVIPYRSVLRIARRSLTRWKRLAIHFLTAVSDSGGIMAPKITSLRRAAGNRLGPGPSEEVIRHSCS